MSERTEKMLAHFDEAKPERCPSIKQVEKVTGLKNVSKEELETAWNAHVAGLEAAAGDEGPDAGETLPEKEQSKGNVKKSDFKYLGKSKVGGVEVRVYRHLETAEKYVDNERVAEQQGAKFYPF